MVCSQSFQKKKLFGNSNLFKMLLPGSWCKGRKYDHITAVLKTWDWLPVTQRINFLNFTAGLQITCDSETKYIPAMLVPYDLTLQGIWGRNKAKWSSSLLSFNTDLKYLSRWHNKTCLYYNSTKICITFVTTLGISYRCTRYSVEHQHALCFEMVSIQLVKTQKSLVKCWKDHWFDHLGSTFGFIQVSEQQFSEQ